MIPTIASVTLGGTLPGKIKAAAAAGFVGLELFDADMEAEGSAPSDLRNMIDDVGLSLIDFFPLRDFEGLPDGQRAMMHDRAARYFDRSAELGAGMVMACSNVHPDSSSDPERIVADLHDVGELAAARGLRLAYEALAWGRHVHDYRVCWELVRQADHPSVGLVLDSFHILARGYDVAPIRTIPSDKIFLVQISDAPILDLDYMNWSRGHRTLPGRGALDLRGFVGALRATGYDGVVSLECFSNQLQMEPASEVANDGHAALNELWATAG